MSQVRAFRVAGIAAVTAAILAVAVPWPRLVDASDDPTISAVQYNREIVRILDRKCVACHSKGGQAMPLDTYRDAKDWGRGIREEMLEHRMPPWPADTGVRPLTNDPSLTVRDIALLLSWVDGGMPRGDAEDLPPPRQATPWRHGEPDDVLALPSQSVKTDGVTVVRTVSVTTTGPARWLRGFDVSPGDRSALRAAFLSLEGPGGTRRWLGTWTPWHATTTPRETAFALPAGAKLSVELHYNAWDDPVRTITDASRIGLDVSAAPPRRPLMSLHLATTSSRPSGESRRRLHGEVTLTADALAWGLRPRLHRRGTAVAGSLEVVATRPDGSVEPLLWLRENGRDWQYAYELGEPVDLPRGSRVRLVAHVTGPDARDAEADVDLAWFAPPAAVTPTETAAIRPGPVAPGPRP